jgi:hypothetical protein
MIKLTNMKKVLYFFVVAIMLLSGLTSCKKEVVAPLSTRLTGKSWKLSKVNTGGTDKVLLDCQKDDKLTFNIAGDFVWNIGTAKCTGELVNKSGNWTADETAQSINVTFSFGGTDKFKVVSCDDKTLVYSYEIKPTAGVTQTETLTWLIVN